MQATTTRRKPRVRRRSHGPGLPTVAFGPGCRPAECPSWNARRPVRTPAGAAVEERHHDAHRAGRLRVPDQPAHRRDGGVPGPERSRREHRLPAAAQSRGYEVFPVDPNAEHVEGDRCWADVVSISGGVDAVVIATRPGWWPTMFGPTADVGHRGMRWCAPCSAPSPGRYETSRGHRLMAVGGVRQWAPSRNGKRLHRG
jgi:hypothetical protein